jgi:hypothetical protein
MPEQDFDLPQGMMLDGQVGIRGEPSGPAPKPPYRGIPKDRAAGRVAPLPLRGEVNGCTRYLLFDGPAFGV